MAMVLSPISSRSLVISRISTACPVNSPRPSLLNSSAVDARRLELAQVLLGQPLVGREQQDAVQLAPPAVLLQVVLVLEDVGVHQQRLAAAGGAPVGQLVELRPGLGGLVEGRNLVGLGLVRVVGGHLRVQRREQRLGIAEVAVEVDLGEEQGQVLEVLPDDRLLAARDAPFVQPLRVLDDVLVVLQQQLGGQLRQVEELRRERVVEVVDVVLVQPFQRLVAQVLGQILEALDVEQRQQPLVEHQLVGERHLRPVVGAAARCGGRQLRRCSSGASSRIGRPPRPRAARAPRIRWRVCRASSCHHAPSISNISRWKSSSISRTFQVSSGVLRFSRLLPPLT